MQPPPRFEQASFDNYNAQEPSQARALDEARRFTEIARRRQRPLYGLRRRFGFTAEDWQGLYLVGPVGTGKTHLLAAAYHALHPEVPCTFVHASTLFRSSDHPEAYAREIAGRSQVLCLDELEIDDAANEARLVLVLKTLERLGVMLLASSNVEPGKFLSSQFGTHRFQRFLDEEFRERYHVVVVGGDDYRRGLDKPGRAWIGAPGETRAAMGTAFEQDTGRKRWIGFEELMELATKIEHTRLIGRLTRPDRLYLADLAPDGTDDALRLLRLIDDLYLDPDAPELYFTSARHPDEWLPADAVREGIERGVAEKFTRTSSRLSALCEIERV